MTREEMTELIELLDKRKGNGWKSYISLGLTILGMVAVFVLFLFKTNLAAEKEHNEIMAAHNADMAAMVEVVHENSEINVDHNARLKAVEQAARDLRDDFRSRK